MMTYSGIFCLFAVDVLLFGGDPDFIARQVEKYSSNSIKPFKPYESINATAEGPRVMGLW